MLVPIWCLKLREKANHLTSKSKQLVPYRQKLLYLQYDDAFPTVFMVIIYWDFVVVFAHLGIFTLCTSCTS